jgi:hypothetical protein
MVETDADLKDAVVQAPDRCGRVAPQQLERLMLFEELAGVELLDASKESLGWRVRAACASRLVRCAGGLPFRRARRFPGAATGLGRARIR